MVPGLYGYTPEPIAYASIPDELNLFTAQEASLPQFSRVIVEVHVDPNEDALAIAQEIQAACTDNSVPCWPEYQGSHVFVEGNTIYIAYMKPLGGVSPTLAFIPILLGILFIAPIIMYFAIPGFQNLINNVISLVVMVMMMKMMTPMFKSLGTGEKKAQKERLLEQRPVQEVPFGQKVTRKIESIAGDVEKTERSFEKSVSAGAAALSSVLNSITGLVGAIRGAPSTAMSGYQKARAARELDALDDKLVKYKEYLTPSQLERLDEEQSTVEELRAMYD